MPSPSNLIFVCYDVQKPFHSLQVLFWGKFYTYTLFLRTGGGKRPTGNDEAIPRVFLTDQTVCLTSFISAVMIFDSVVATVPPILRYFFSKNVSAFAERSHALTGFPLFVRRWFFFSWCCGSRSHSFGHRRGFGSAGKKISQPSGRPDSGRTLTSVNGPSRSKCLFFFLFCGSSRHRSPTEETESCFFFWGGGGGVSVEPEQEKGSPENNWKSRRRKKGLIDHSGEGK